MKKLFAVLMVAVLAVGCCSSCRWRYKNAIGGGVSVGYRMPISKNRRWRMEFTVGAGVYDLHYDKFRNTVTVEDGLLVESIKESYWGIDQAALSFIYTFDLKKKGGTR